MPSFIDLSGKRFNRLVVLRRDKTVDGRTRWVCRCDCGKTKSVLAYNIKHKDPSRRIYSCGCYAKERQKENATTHGMSKTLEFFLFLGAKKRSKENGLKFNISVKDISIPKSCPLLGIKIFKSGKKQTDNSPSLDRINPKLGYVKSNIQVISYKANAIKRNCSFQEFEKIYKNWKRQKT